MQPLLARYEPSALPLLLAALSEPPRPLTEVVERLEPLLLEVDGEAEAFFNVNLPEDLLTATAMMDRTD
jgi:molybdopterin-guanine dinucleotide biosynthesis protein A